MTDVLEDLRPLSIPEVVAQLTASDGTRLVSEEQVKRYLRQRRWPGCKVGHRWAMTRAQIQQALDIESRAARAPRQPPASGVSPRSRTRKASAE
ncbi:excise [Gordonia phage Marteena]|nr:excise [Gordonia phage EMsquaredA]QDP45132.1 excise [Gordonia phage Marteena]